ncbi:protein-tyrosine phosphatase-like protein [Phycomyces blakesleeanus]
MPLTTCVLTCHGLNDTIVSPTNAAQFANTINNHDLQLIPNADHNYSDHKDILIKTIINHIEKHRIDAYAKAMSMGQHVGLTIPRWIDVEGVKNFRDIGGWALRDGSGYIRERIVFRCGNLVGIKPSGIKTLQQLNVIAAFDFRSDPEVERQGVMPEIPGLTRVPSAMFTKDDYSPAALSVRWKGYFEGPTGFPKVYRIILEKAGPKYRSIFLHLLEHHSTQSTKSIIVHCTAGKDRTGLFVMLLFGLCGVDEEVIANEYALTNLGYWEPEHELEAKARSLGATLDNVRMVMSAPYLAMKQTIELVKEVYGSIEGYIRKECGLTDEQIKEIRKLMVVPIRFEERQLFRPLPY